VGSGLDESTGVRLRHAAIAATVLVLAATQPAAAAFPGSNGRIAFLRPDHGANQIFSMNADGSDVRQLTHMGPRHQAISLAWSPDGSQIVFERVNARWEHNHIWIMSAAGTHSHLLFQDPWFTDHSPSFSPDGMRVIFSRCQPDPGADQGRCAVTTVRVDGTGLTELTTPSAEELVFWPRYSPDGSQIASTILYGHGVRSAVFVMEADGSQVTRVTPPELGGFAPDWAPDGGQLIFGTRCCDPTSAIWAVRPDGSGLAAITTPGDAHDFGPCYAPDGSKIVFERDSSDFSRFGLYLMNADGTGVTRLLNRAWGPAWQPASSG
jgi:TolB protein